MKKFKKFFAVILSLAMVLGMSLTSFAAPENVVYPSATDHKVVTVNGLKAGDVVKFYKIVEPNFNDNDAFTGYSAIDPYKIDDVYAPTAEEITTIAKQVASKDLKATVTVEVDKAEADLVVGTYLVLVTSANDDTIYNPMIASVYYTQGGVKVDAISAGDNFEIGDDVAYAKSSGVNLTKVITDPIDSHENNKGNDVAIGDTIGFEITADLPSYSDEYDTDKLVYRITDTLSGLDNVRDITVYLDSKDGDPVDEVNYDLQVATDGTSYVIDFDKAYIKSLNASTHKFYVTYKATLASTAGINYDFNENTATLEYTNKPGTEDNVGKKESKTYHYTFGIDAEINGEGSYKTGELFKTETGEEVYTESETGGTITHPLEGAVFSLQKATKDEAGNYTPDNNVEAITSESDATGRIPFRGLDAGSYILTETKAPAGYTLNTTSYYIDIKASYDGDGKLLQYSIEINNGTETLETIHAKNTVENDGELVEVIDHRTETAFFVNTKLAELPSTGGIGTTIFTIGGCLIMVIAAGLFFASRRKSAK